MKEISVQKGLSYGMVASLVSIPFTGPFGIIGAGSFLVAKMYRGMSNEDTHNKLLEERKEIKEKKKAEKVREKMFDYLHEEIERRGHISSMKEGSDILNKYLSNLPYEDYSRIKQMEILERENTFLGFPIGKKSLEVRTII